MVDHRFCVGQHFCRTFGGRRIQVCFPDGTEAPYGECVAVEDGRHIFEITPAVNEPRGKWKIKATELAFGTTCETFMEMK